MIALAVALTVALCLMIVVLWAVVSGRVFSGCVLFLGSARCSVLSMMVVAEGTVRSAGRGVGVLEEDSPKKSKTFTLTTTTSTPSTAIGVLRMSKNLRVVGHLLLWQTPTARQSTPPR